MSSIDLKDVFFVECEDLLVAMDEGLRELEAGSTDPETVNAVFRAVHSIKGGAGAFALADLVNFAHKFETVLDDVRASRIETNPTLFGAFLVAGDHLADLVAAARDGVQTDPSASEKAIAALNMAGGQDDAPADSVEISAPVFAPLALDLDLPLPVTGPEGRNFRIALKPKDSAINAGHDAALLLQQLAELGTLSTTIDASALPDATAFDPNKSYLGWTADLLTEHSLAEIEEVFDFAKDDCELDISEIEAPVPDLPPLPDLVEPQDTAENVIAEVSELAPQPVKAEAAKSKSGSTAAPRQTIRVDIERVDRLVDVVGELVIHQAMLSEAIEQSGLRIEAEVERGLDQLRQLSRQIQESVMSIRAQPVKPLFDRMHRIVREASAAANKTARLITEGEMTEVDKTIIERLADPLTHMIRNAVDHGLEKMEKRLESGKSEEGVVTLSAAHRSGRVLITLSDDGGGIDRDRVKQVAISKGLIPASADLTPSEIDNLLFLPGFSTASEVSNLSGRGVGMDVVKSEIAGLGGRVSIASVRGEGTTLTISLPLTLAVLDGMVVEVSGQLLVLPVSSIIETLRPEAEAKHSIGTGDTVLDVRGTFVPLIDVGTRLGFREVTASDCGSIVVLVERDDDDCLALMVDGIRDQRQVVIKGLEGNYGHIPGIAAATVLGDGSVALILDPSDLANPSSSQRSALQPVAAE